MEITTSSSPERPNLRRHKSQLLFSSDHDSNYDDHSLDFSTNSSTSTSPSSPSTPPSSDVESPGAHNGLIGSLTREEGHIYSIAAAGDLLLTGSESKYVRAWKNLTDISGFKSGSGMVKAIVVLDGKIFTGHHDGKIRVWTYDESLNCSRIGNLPKSQDSLARSMNPVNYLKVGSKRRAPWLKHCDTVSCMSVDAGRGLLYSGSWDKTLKVWRISDSKCLESITAHDDAVNSVATAVEGLVFTGSADGTVKAWRREFVGNGTKHLLLETMTEEVGAVTAVVVSHGGRDVAECKHAATVVYAGYSDGLVRFWEVEKQSMAYGGILRGHKMAVLCLVVGGNLVMSGSADKSICVWRRDGGGKHTCTAVLTGHRGPVKCLAVENDTSTAANEEEDGRRRWTVFSGSLDKCVKIWSVSE